MPLIFEEVELDKNSKSTQQSGDIPLAAENGKIPKLVINPPTENLPLSSSAFKKFSKISDTSESAEEEDVGVHIIRMDAAGGKNLANPAKNQNLWTKYRGIIFAVTASLFFSLTAVIVKLLKEYHPFSVSVWRHAAILIPTLVVILFYQMGLDKKMACRKGGKSQKNLPQDAQQEMMETETKIFASVFPINGPEKRILFLCLLARGLIGATALLLQVWSLKYLSVGDSSIFTFSAPVFVVIFAHFCLKEKCGIISVLVAILTFCGVVVIVRPPFLTGEATYDLDNLQGATLAFVSMLLNSIVIIIVRRIRQVHWSLILLIFGILGVIENLVVAISFGILEWPHGVHDCLLTYVALPTTVYAAQMAIMLALKFEAAGPVALVGTSGVVFSFLLQFGLFGVPPDIYSVIGSTIVIFGVFVTTLRKWMAGLPPEDQRRKRFKWLLL